MFDVDRALLHEAALRLASARGLRSVIGGACSGTSTVCQAISRWTDVPIYAMDEHVASIWRWPVECSAPALGGIGVSAVLGSAVGRHENDP